MNIEMKQSSEISESSVDDDLERLKINHKKRKRKSGGRMPQLKDLDNTLSIRCEWNMCSEVLLTMKKYLFHIAEHVASVSGPASTEEGFLCQWQMCGFATPVRNEFDRHIYYHAFHSKLKSIGEMFLDMIKVKCSMDCQNRNVIPEIPEPFQCLWECCNFTFLSAQDFYWHVQGHVMSVEKTREGFECGWEGCSYNATLRNRLTNHARSHTQERIIGCPRCGSIFSSNYKLIDHCQRHVDENTRTYECSHCQRKFSTERLLKEHVRRHVNHFKCPHCEMTCTSKTSLDVHMKYRHTNHKPFACPECSKRFKFQWDVARHMTIHAQDNSFLCYYTSCDFNCKSYESYIVHIRTKHEGGIAKPYVCHMCDMKFVRGARLTIHLKKKHDYQWPAGHSRFRYSKGEDGFYRLQTTRFESVELAQKMISLENGSISEDEDQEDDLEDDYELEIDNDVQLDEEIDDPGIEDAHQNTRNGDFVSSDFEYFSVTNSEVNKHEMNNR